MDCPLCFHSNKDPYYQNFWRCSECDLTFLSPSSRLDLDLEKKRYLLHQNDIKDEGYLNFLNKILIPLKNFIKKENKGLDFGSGPYPMLSEILSKEGYNIDSYDPIFSPKDLQDNYYDFIICCEVAEHFYSPFHEFKRLSTLLKQDGVLAIMTGIFYEDYSFDKWHYKNDPTHVCLYSLKTFDFIEAKFGFKKLFEDKNIIFFAKI